MICGGANTRRREGDANVTKTGHSMHILVSGDGTPEIAKQNKRNLLRYIAMPPPPLPARGRVVY